MARDSEEKELVRERMCWTTAIQVLFLVLFIAVDGNLFRRGADNALL